LWRRFEKKKGEKKKKKDMEKKKFGSFPKGARNPRGGQVKKITEESWEKKKTKRSLGLSTERIRKVQETAPAVRIAVVEDFQKRLSGFKTKKDPGKKAPIRGELSIKEEVKKKNGAG